MSLPQSYLAFLEANPICRFSIYTHEQIRTLTTLALELTSLLDASMQDGCCEAPAYIRAYGLFWLWILGAYEVTRTMCQADSCFSPSATQSLKSFKKKIAELRIPFAKQEYATRGRKAPIRSEASVWRISTSTKDLLFEVKGIEFSVRGLMREFELLMTSIKPQDVLEDHRNARGYRGK